jgi:uncharacterized protein (DUF3084 family)
MDEETREKFSEVDARFAQVDARFEQVDARFEQVDARFQRIETRLDAIDRRFEWLMVGIAQQFEAMQKYMDGRFNEILEALDVRASPIERQVRDHERRLRRLEDRAPGDPAKN